MRRISVVAYGGDDAGRCRPRAQLDLLLLFIQGSFCGRRRGRAHSGRSSICDRQGPEGSVTLLLPHAAHVCCLQVAEDGDHHEERAHDSLELFLAIP